MKLKNFLIPIVYAGIFFATSYLKSGIDYLDLTLFAVGLTFGVVLMFLDEIFLYKYYLAKDATKINLMTRSLLFITSLIPLGFFIVTSTGSKLGTGLLLGIITTLVLELVEARNNSDYFHSRFLFQLKRKISNKEMNIFVGLFSFSALIFAMMTLFLGG
jgi:hypothetical protein